MIVFQFKCRLCGKLSQQSKTRMSDKKALKLLISCFQGGKKNQDGVPLSLLSVHICGDKSIGVAELIGYEEIVPEKSFKKVTYTNENDLKGGVTVYYKDCEYITGNRRQEEVELYYNGDFCRTVKIKDVYSIIREV